jgi:hypothetical protein
MPAGRPTKITKELEKRIAELFWLAFTDEQVATFTDLSRKTIQRMRAGEFCPAIKKAEIKRESIYRKKIWAGRNGWQGAAWAMERKYPGQFSKPEVMMQINNNVLNQTTNNALVLTAEVVEGMVGRLKPAEDKVDLLFKAKRVTNGNGNGYKQAPDG